MLASQCQHRAVSLLDDIITILKDLALGFITIPVQQRNKAMNPLLACPSRQLTPELANGVFCPSGNDGINGSFAKATAYLLEHSLRKGSIPGRKQAFGFRCQVVNMQRPAALPSLDIIGDQLITPQECEVAAYADLAHPDRGGQVFYRQPPVTLQTVQNCGTGALQDMFNRRRHDYILESLGPFVNQTIIKWCDDRPAVSRNTEAGIKREGETFYRYVLGVHW